MLDKGRSRGGSVFLLGFDDVHDEIDDGDGDGFSLTAQEPAAPAAAPKATGKKKVVRKSDGPVQMLSYRYAETRVTEQNTTVLTPVFDEENPIGSTGQMRAWYTTKPNMPTGKSHISHVVRDSAWEQYAANVLESRDDVIAYAKNDHLGFQIHYLWQESRRRYIPDFIVRLANGKTLALEIKGTDSEQNKAKREALDEWVQAVNSSGGFGEWSWDVAFDPSHIHDIVARYGK